MFPKAEIAKRICQHLRTGFEAVARLVSFDTLISHQNKVKGNWYSNIGIWGKVYKEFQSLL
jgi:hypothetical protein